LALSVPITRKTCFSLTTKVSPNILIIRNPKAFEVWPTCSYNIYCVITQLGMLRFPKVNPSIGAKLKPERISEFPSLSNVNPSPIFLLNLGAQDLHKINSPHPFLKGHPIGFCTKCRLSSSHRFEAYFYCGIGERGTLDIYFDVPNGLP
jgi:hypothetical protein